MGKVLGGGRERDGMDRKGDGNRSIPLLLLRTSRPECIGGEGTALEQRTVINVPWTHDVRHQLTY